MPSASCLRGILSKQQQTGGGGRRWRGNRTRKGRGTNGICDKRRQRTRHSGTGLRTRHRLLPRNSYRRFPALARNLAHATPQPAGARTSHSPQHIACDGRINAGAHSLPRDICFSFGGGTLRLRVCCALRAHLCLLRLPPLSSLALYQTRCGRRTPVGATEQCAFLSA